MKPLKRFGISIKGSLLDQFDSFIFEKGYKNRSEAIRDILRSELIKKKLQTGSGSAFGILTFIYDHHQRELEETLTSFQHDYFKNIISATHVHIDHDHCLEIIILKGPVKNLKTFTDHLFSIKGVKNGNLTLTLPIQEGKHHH